MGLGGAYAPRAGNPAGIGFTWGGVTVYPFVEQVSGTTIVKFVNQGNVQIVSAGEDGMFGPGCPGPLSTPANPIQCKYVPGQSGPAAGVSPYAEGDAGADDVGNFNNGNKLGVGR